MKNVAVLVAVGVRADGHREMLGVAEGTKEDSESWRSFLRYLKERGLHGVRMITSDKFIGLVEALSDFFSGGGLATLQGSLLSYCSQRRASHQIP